MNKRKILIAITFVIMILTISACSPKGDKKEVDTGKKQTNLDTEDLGLEPKLPEFLLKNIEDEEVSSDIFKDNDINIVSIWQSSCEPCTGQLEALKIIYDEYKEDSVNVIGIAVDNIELEGKENIKKIVEDSKLNFVNLMADNMYRDMLLDYVGGTPTIFVVGRDGQFLMSPMAGSPGKEEDIERFRAIIEAAKE